MSKELVVIDTLPRLPDKWNYNESVEKTKQHIFKWRNLTIDLATELWIAKQILIKTAHVQPRGTGGIFIPTDANWSKYCEDIGSSRQVVNNWLKRLGLDEDEGEDNKPSGEVENIPSNITLLEGDIFDKLAEVQDESIDLLLTDPPYGVMEDYEWDEKELIFLDGWIKAVKPKLKPIHNAFIFCDARRQYHFEGVIRSNELNIKNRIIWIRKNMSKGRVIADHFISSYEIIFFIGNRELNLPKEWGAERFDSCEFAVPQSNFEDKKLHPTQKPLALIKHLASVGSFPGDIILDCFAGSGTTGIACLELEDRTCILIEKETDYVNIIKGRFNELGR